MPAAQGKLPSTVYLPGRMTGADESHAPTTNNSQVYRGRPYSFANKYDQAAMDWMREKAKVSWQEGLKVVQIYMTTSQNPIQ